MKLRAIAKEIFLGTLRRISVSEAIRSRVQYRNRQLHVAGRVYPMQQFHRLAVIAIGKAAAPMADALLDAIDPALSGFQYIDSIVVGPTKPQRDDSRVRYFRGSHPFSDQTAHDAADAILALLQACDEATLVIFLVSGGASAMVEKPLGARISLEDEALFQRALVQSGLPITQMNVLRKHFSRVKGGRLAVAAQRAAQCTLLISDVPHSTPHVIGSGPSLPDPSTIQECRRIIHVNLASLHLPDRVLAFFHGPECEETPKLDHPAFQRAHSALLLSSDDLTARAGELARLDGFHVVVDNTCDDWDYREAAAYLLNRLSGLRQQFPRVCLLSVGEVSVQIPPAHGLGGRNQQFALECARRLDQQNLSATVLSGGSDGVDGNSPAAGAICDETTFQRAAASGLDPLGALERFDSFTLFSALGDAMLTRPTGNNLRDLRILLSEA